MPTFVPLGGDLAGNLVAGLIGNNIVDAFAVADANGQTGKLLRHLIGPAFDEFKSLADMNAIAASATAMNVIAASETAMNAVAASATAMNAVAASATARNAIRNSSTAFNIVAGSNIAIGKFVAGEVGLNPAAYADMNAVAASETAMNAVAASATAMNAIAASATALSAICKSETAAVAVKSAIQNYRSQVVATLEAAVGSKFSKSTIAVGPGGRTGIFDSELSTNTIYIPIRIEDNGYGGPYEIYYGADVYYKIGSYSVGSSNSPFTVSEGVSMRGIRLIKETTSGDTERLICDVYTAV